MYFLQIILIVVCKNNEDKMNKKELENRILSSRQKNNRQQFDWKEIK